MPARRKPPRLLHASLLITLATGCAASPADRVASARAGIEAQIARSAEATRREDIDAYLAVLAPDFAVQNDDWGDEHGERLSREEQRAAILRDWGIITEHRVVDTRIDSLSVAGDSAIAYTSQRYERLMLQRDGVTVDTVFTSVRHRERWRRSAAGWQLARVQELEHGPILVNGRVYEP